MNEQVATFFERLAGKTPAQRLLRRMGLDPRQFVLFLELFRTLSEREELVGMVGVSRFQISYLALYSFATGVIPWLIAAALPARIFIMLNLSIAFALTFLVIARESASTLFNPVEASMLANRPVHSPTYAAAKIVHVLIAVLYLTSGLTVYPAVVAALFNPGTRWFWLLTHLSAAFLMGLWTAFFICALYGLLTKVVPSNLLKGISTWIQLISLIGCIAIPIFFRGFLLSLLTARFDGSRWTWLPLTWFAELGLMGCRNASWRLGWQGVWSILASVVIIWYGLRSFSRICLSEGSSMTEGGAWTSREQNLLSAGLVRLYRALTGSPSALGAFCFISKMIRRDWQFRRAILTQIWIPLLIALAILLDAFHRGFFSSPLGHESAAHILPHLLGLVTMAFCLNILFTDFHCGSWIFLTVPIHTAQEFARGVYWALWFPSAALPNLIMLPFMIHFWGWQEAALFAGFSAVVVSLYLAFQITLISGLPFSAPVNESHVAGYSIYIQICGLLAISFAVALQEVLFRRWWIALSSSVLLVILTGFVVHWSLVELDENIRWRLHIMKVGSGQMFREIE